MKDSTIQLKNEAQSLINKIKEIYPTGARLYFCQMFEEYYNDEEPKKPSSRLNNLWYCNSTDKKFNEHLNQFLEAKSNGKS